MLKRFVIAKSFRLHISKPKKIPGNIFVDISKVRKSSRRGLLGRQNCILSQKSVPQGPFGWMKLHFEPEKRPAGAFWADKSNPRPMPQSPGRLQGGGPPGGPGEGMQHHLNPKVGGTGGKAGGTLTAC